MAIFRKLLLVLKQEKARCLFLFWCRILATNFHFYISADSLIGLSAIIRIGKHIKPILSLRNTPTSIFCDAYMCMNGRIKKTHPVLPHEQLLSIS
jgi:hypothetical protein